MTDKTPKDNEESDSPPPVDGMEYPEMPDGDASMEEKIAWMEAVDHYWTKRGLQKLDEDDNNEESTDDQG